MPSPASSSPLSSPSSSFPSRDESHHDDISDLLGGRGGDSGASASIIPEDYDPLSESFGTDRSDRSFGQQDWQRAAEPDHLPAEAQYFAPPKVDRLDSSTGGQIPEDWFADEDDGADHGTISPPGASTASSPSGAPPAEAPRRPRPGAAASASMPTDLPASTPGDVTALFEAFLEGAGLSGATGSAGQEEELLRRIGVSYREMAKGLCELLRVRQSIKNEFRLEKTVIQSGENNPLKFSVTPEEAVRALVFPPAAGYLNAEEAVSESIDDLKAHQLAVMAGMQLALTSLLRNFDPEALEKRLQDSSVWGNILPGAKKARYWEVFTELYNEIAKEAESNFYGLFGQAFAKAYEEQINHLKARQ